MTGSSNGHLYSLDMMKFVAAIFITNSHFQPLYEGVNTAFATFGVQGKCAVLLCSRVSSNDGIWKA